jgi:hypothetical protein
MFEGSEWILLLGGQQLRRADTLVGRLPESALRSLPIEVPTERRRC